jgi:hypothetical protein
MGAMVPDVMSLFTFGVVLGDGKTKEQMSPTRTTD